MRASFFSLHWRDIDPAAHPCDLSPGREIVERHVRKLAESLPKVRNYVLGDKAQDTCEYEITLDLVAHYGLWIAGWTWSCSEPGGGGPVKSWCCSRDSLLPKNDSIETSISRVVNAIGEWRAFLEEIAIAQMELQTKTKDLPPETAIEIIATHYLPIVIEKSQCNDAWYNLYDKVLQWHFEALGHDDLRIKQAIIQARSGKFESWTQPAPDVAQQVIQQLTIGLSEALTAPVDTTDALLEWLTLRRKTNWTDTYGYNVQPCADGHLAFIEKYDIPRSSERARLFRNALTFMREHASTPLNWSLLCEAQKRALGQRKIDFRNGDAFAKNGRERYGLGPKTRMEFEKCLSEANDSALSPQARAARVYLDICFFHPFVDGNARAARLALDHVLTQAGLSLAIADPIFLFALHARDPEVAWRFRHLVSIVVGTMKKN